MDIQQTLRAYDEDKNYLFDQYSTHRLLDCDIRTNLNYDEREKI